jgi:Ni,Fe-hydrogenase I cytochrome b subunit
MSDTHTRRIYIFKLYERFWHWSQAALILVLLLTGFEIHGSFENFGFERAVRCHTRTFAR